MPYIMKINEDITFINVDVIVNSLGIKGDVYGSLCEDIIKYSFSSELKEYIDSLTNNKIGTIYETKGYYLPCKEIFHFSVLLSAFFGFTISVIYNYIASVKWVFNVNQEKSKTKNFIIFVIFSVIGLILTELIMWFGTGIIKISYLIVKVFATIIVMIFNIAVGKINNVMIGNNNYSIIATSN